MRARLFSCAEPGPHLLCLNSNPATSLFRPFSLGLTLSLSLAPAQLDYTLEGT